MVQVINLENGQDSAEMGEKTVKEIREFVLGG